MSEKQGTDHVATITVHFNSERDASFEFSVNKDITHPTSSHLESIAFAKIISDLVLGILESDSTSTIFELVKFASVRGRDEDA